MNDNQPTKDVIDVSNPPPSGSGISLRIPVVPGESKTKDTLDSSDTSLDGSDVLMSPASRRIMRLAFSPQLIMSFYDNRDIHVKITENGLLVDTKYLGCAYDLATDTIWINISHEAFKEVKHGDIIPIHDPVRFQAIAKCDNCTVEDESL